ncbi:MAG TPA: ABC transporter ATP-binding protein [Cyanobacteria bacterium UBA8803]|nr:ABC transporter ATP-binding protein [Cyanobacteria bacterium UBA9273]HBL57836.1 ABC transporter ATP-binding protein [Cyanobacteria bacterium UBA8803]
MLKYLSKVLYVLTGNRKNLALLLFSFSLTSVLEALGIGMIAPFLSLASNPESIHKIALLAWLYAQLGLTSDNQLILLLGLAVICIFCIKAIVYFLSSSYIYKFSYDQKSLLVSRLLHAYLVVPYTFHLNRNTSTLIENIIIETNHFTYLCLLPLLIASANCIVVIILLLLLAKTDLLLLVMVLAILLPVFLWLARFGNKFKEWGKISSESQQGMIRTINHGLGGLKETRVIGCEAYFQSEMEQHANNYSRSAYLFNSYQLIPRVSIETIMVIFLIGFVSLSQIILNQDFQDLIASISVFSVAAMRMIPSASQLTQSMGNLKNSSYAVNQLYFDLKEIEKQNLNFSSKLVDSDQKMHDESQAMAFNQQVELQEITYRYPNISELAIEKISLTIKKGQSIGLIGKSGAGKTTLVDVILGLLQPESGDIKVDGISIYNNLRYWQNLVGYIPQSIFLIDDTIEHNIAFGVPDSLIDSERLEQAIKTAQLEELVDQLPEGIKTSVGERGVRLSGGQRQRIGIARALYHEREILVLDEATSALDTETERLVSEAIKSLAGTKTLIIIAHRLSTVEHCDCIYLLEKGRVIRSGSYQEVILST